MFIKNRKTGLCEGGTNAGEGRTAHREALETPDILIMQVCLKQGNKYPLSIQKVGS